MDFENAGELASLGPMAWAFSSNTKLTFPDKTKRDQLQGKPFHDFIQQCTNFK